MCGIIGKVGTEEVLPSLLRGLDRLEYRGYDSSGVALLDGGELCCVKSKGRLSELRKRLDDGVYKQNCGVAHTRWATHGIPDERNAHPHVSPCGLFAVVHNGIIENAEDIKHTLLHGNTFISDTDTEVFAHLLEKYYSGDVIFAMANACAVLKGTYAFGVVCTEHPDMIFGASSGSPLVVSECETGMYIASDKGAVGEPCRRVYGLRNGELCAVERDIIKFYDPTGKEIKKAYDSVTVVSDEQDKGDFRHFMLKEIYDQPKAVEDTVKSLVAGNSIVLPDVSAGDDFFADEMERIVIVGCGSAYHAGLVGKRVIERLCRIPCSVEIASEFRYSDPFINEKTLAIFVSQSGETADTLASLRLAKKHGASILSIVNVKGSVIAEESENVIYTVAGKEVAVATTKAYSAQLTAFYAFAVYVASVRKTVQRERYGLLVRELKQLPEKIKKTIDRTSEDARDVAELLKNKTDVFFIGRLSDFAVASEGSLKMKEISYINSQAYASGELKHGTISLVEKGTPIVAVAGEKGVFSKSMSNVSEVVSRGAWVLGITDEKKASAMINVQRTITVPETAEEFRALLLTVPLQLLSYFTALVRGCDIDKPRNLAKSVTVE